MRRAILLAGCGRRADELLREYAVIPLPRLPRARSIRAWQRLAESLEVELSASWLVLGGNAGQVAEDVQAGLRGCLAAPTTGEVARILKRLDGAASRSRLLTDFETVSARCERLRRAGKCLVFTNGIFDLFHLGHARLLEAARALGEALVVGVNSDDSARSLKGRSRPVVPQFARAEIVAGFRGVSFCVVFEQGDPLELLRAVRPDVLVKGGEYALTGIVGRRLVEGWGGKVCRIPHVSGWSSTGLLKSLRGW